MNAWRWLGTLVFLAAMALVAAPREPAYGQEKGKEKEKAKAQEKGKEQEKAKPATPQAGGDTLEWKAFDPKGKEFFQELYTKTTQTMKVMGQEVQQTQEQTFYISWTPTEKDKDNWCVTQKIIGVKMAIDIGGNKISYDSTGESQPSNPMSDFFTQLQKLELKLCINPKDMKVAKVEGGDEFVKKLGQSNQAMEPLLKAILSEKALKQMAEPTWGAFPTVPVTKGKSWSSDSDLDLGPIGSYKTKYEYTYEGTEKDKGDKITIKATLTYTKPTKQNGLPFKIKEAQLESKDGTGVAYFDRKAGRFSSSEMKMDLKGFLTVEVAGMESKVDLDQKQEARVRTMDENPVKKAEPKKK